MLMKLKYHSPTRWIHWSTHRTRSHWTWPHQTRSTHHRTSKSTRRSYLFTVCMNNFFLQLSKKVISWSASRSSPWRSLLVSVKIRSFLLKKENFVKTHHSSKKKFSVKTAQQTFVWIKSLFPLVTIH